MMGIFSHIFTNRVTDIFLYPAISGDDKELLFAGTLLSEEDGS